MADYNNYLHPFKQIVINVYPNLARRVSSKLKGKYHRGLTSNLSFNSYLAFLFEINEYLPKEHKLTDFQIARCVNNEFPKRKGAKSILIYESGKSPWHKEHSIATHRNRYNHGWIPTIRGGVRLGPISYSYNDEGLRLNRHGNILTKEQKITWDNKFNPETRKDIPDFDWKAVNTKPSKYKRVNKYDSFDWCI